MNINTYLINADQTIEEALRTIDKNGEKSCFIIDHNQKLIGSLTDGDIRRSIFKKKKKYKRKSN